MNTTTSQPLSYPVVGQRIRLRRPASVAWPPRGEAGMTGIVHAVVTAPGSELISVKMTQPLPDATLRWDMNRDEAWWNCLEWSGVEAVSSFLDDCELLPSVFPAVGQYIRLIREVDRLPYFRAVRHMTGILTKVILTPGAEYIRAQIDQDLLSDHPELQDHIEVELRNSIEWEDFSTVATFFQDGVLYPAIDQRIRLRGSIASSSAVALTGRVTGVNPNVGEDFIRVEMDQSLFDSSEVEALSALVEREHRTITWQYQVLSGQNHQTALDLFLADCEYIEASDPTSQELLPAQPSLLPGDQETEGDLQPGDVLKPVYGAQATLKKYPEVQRWVTDVFGEAGAAVIADGLQALVDWSLATNPPWKIWALDQAPALLFPIRNPATENVLYYEIASSGSGIFVTIHRSLPSITHAHDESRQTAIAGLHIDYHLDTSDETREQVKVQLNDEWTSPYGDHGWSTPGGYRYSDESIVLVEDVQTWRNDQGREGDA